MQLWNHVYIKIMDIRHTTLQRGEELRSYRLPASAFLFVLRGSAQVSRDGDKSTANRFHVLHAGKGVCLDIAADELFEYCTIMYKAVLALPSRRELVQLMNSGSPFQLQYGFAPRHPLSLLDKVERMEQAWRQTDMPDKLYIKGLFYQFVSDVLLQLSRQGAAVEQPDPVSQAIRYLRERYKEPITLDTLADMLECSPRQLLRLFKERMNASPIDYLIRIRMERAKERLLGAGLTVKEIAESVGYADSYYFSRLFKKFEGMSPAAYKANAAMARPCPDNPSRMSIYAIAAGRPRRYIDDEYENHYQYEGKVGLPMYRKSKTAVLATLLFCLTLLFSACAGGTSGLTQTGGAAAESEGKPAAAPKAASSADNETPRVVKHAMGETTLVGTPKRVVILTNEGTEALLALGVKPVGAVKSWSGDPWYNHIKDDMKDVAVVGDEMQPNMEVIATLKPDLIIGNKVRQEKVYEQLQKIAPTVFSEDLGGDWKENFKLYMEAVDKKEEGAKLLADFDKRVIEAKAKLGGKTAAKISVVRFSAAQVRIYQKQTFSGALLSQLGFARPAAQDKDGNIEVMSKERIPDMDGDVMFYFVTETPGKNDADKVVQDWMNDRLFQNLNVAKNHQIKQVDEAIWNSAGGYEAANLLLDQIVDYFSKAN
ncbi:AraC family transcriptional regulator [Paenibacillus doosanensis]|nr:AraC family transcriptional regulator [Paenibacillus konkukensis]MCS7464106.1 AraC family transcriptional regulator [Paenibacillus doosanensis]